MVLHYGLFSKQGDVGVFKSDPPIPDSLGKEDRNDFHAPPPGFGVEAPEVEEDPLTSSDESSVGEKRRMCESDKQG